MILFITSIDGLFGALPPTFFLSGSTRNLGYLIVCGSVFLTVLFS